MIPVLKAIALKIDWSVIDAYLDRKHAFNVANAAIIASWHDGVTDEQKAAFMCAFNARQAALFEVHAMLESVGRERSLAYDAMLQQVLYVTRPMPLTWDDITNATVIERPAASRRVNAT